MSTALAYWEERARRYAAEGAGLRAVCSYGMPGFYNRAIHAGQRRALRPWLALAPGASVLDLGCGVGRWSLPLARQGARVTGVDLSPSMLREAARRAAAEGVAERCRFVAADVSRLSLRQRFDLVLGVTVLQHVTDSARLQAALEGIAAHLAPGGRALLLEAAPRRAAAGLEHPMFRARTVRTYLEAFARAGLRTLHVTGVDAPALKVRGLRLYPRWPRPLAHAALLALTLATQPLEALLGRAWTRASWHKLFVLAPEEP